LMGGPASGKTTIAKTVTGEAFNDFVNVNPDDVKEMIPEYNEALQFELDGQKTSARDAAFMVHYESSEIADEVYKRAVAEGSNVIIDGTGRKADKHIARVRELQKQGYHVQLLMPDLDAGTAIRRAADRAEATGRFVPSGSPPPGMPNIIEDTYKQLEGNFERISRHADEFSLFDSRKWPPDVKWSGGKGVEDIIHDKDFVSKFTGGTMSKSEGASSPEKPYVTAEDILERLKGSKLEWEGKPKRFDRRMGAFQVIDDPEYGKKPALKYDE
jgi:predicted ABC-type ATPase